MPIASIACPHTVLLIGAVKPPAVSRSQEAGVGTGLNKRTLRCFMFYYGLIRSLGGRYSGPTQLDRSGCQADRFSPA